MGEGDEREFVHLGYERLADHFTAQSILETVSKTDTSQSSADRTLTGDDHRLSSGVLESLFIPVSYTHLGMKV